MSAEREHNFLPEDYELNEPEEFEDSLENRETAAMVFAMELAATGQEIEFSLTDAIKEPVVVENIVQEGRESRLKRKLRERRQQFHQPLYTQGQRDYFAVRTPEEQEAEKLRVERSMLQKKEKSRIGAPMPPIVFGKTVEESDSQS